MSDSTFDIFTKISSWYSGTEWTTTKADLLTSLRLDPTKTSLEIDGTVHSSDSGNKYTMSYGSLELFGDIKVIVENMKLNVSKKKLSLTVKPSFSGASWNLSGAFPDIAAFSMLDKLIQNPVFIWTVDVTGSGSDKKTNIELQFHADVSVTGYDLGEKASEFISFFGKSGTAQQLLQEFNGGIISDTIKISGTIDLTKPIATRYSGNVPNVQLKAHLTQSEDSFTIFNYLEVKNPRIALTTVPGPVTEKPTGSPSVALPDFAGIEPTFEVDLIIDKADGSPIDVVLSAGAPPAYAAMTFKIAATKGHTITLSQIFALMNGNSWEGLIPGEMQQAMNSVGYQSFSANISFPKSDDSDSKFTLNWVTCEVQGTFSGTQQLLPMLSLGDVDFTCIWTVFNPLEEDKMTAGVTFNGQSTITLHSTPIKMSIAITDNDI